MEEGEHERAPAAAAAHWEHFDHGADIGVRGVGRTAAQAFEQAALALTAVVTDPANVQLREAKRLECEAAELDDLFYRWLNAVIYEMSAERLLFGHFDVVIDRGRLTATLSGEGVVPERHRPAVEVKGATYTELRVGRREDGFWYAQCIVDV